MSPAIRHDLTQLVKRWDEEITTLKRLQADWPMNHVHWRIYEGMKNQTVADLGEIISLMKRHDGVDQCEQKLGDALAENYNLKKELGRA